MCSSDLHAGLDPTKPLESQLDALQRRDFFDEASVVSTSSFSIYKLIYYVSFENDSWLKLLVVRPMSGD